LRRSHRALPLRPNPQMATLQPGINGCALPYPGRSASSMG
jgi:hypothetical protein